MEPYKTKDRHEIMILIASGCDQTLPARREHDGAIWFTFSDQNTCASILRKHLSGHLDLNTLNVVGAQETMKSVFKKYGSPRT